MQSFEAKIRNRIVALIEAILEQNALPGVVAPGARLIDIGLTSMDMVNLMLGVEAEFDFAIPQTEITADNFQSVEAPERMIVGQLHGTAAA